ncbi:MAG: hypothetical protein ABI356_15800, partial [Steroidobacteraceae bacterium]
ISGELGWFPIDDAHRTVSVWGGLEAPTGSVAEFTGDGAWDGAAVNTAPDITFFLGIRRQSGAK